MKNLPHLFVFIILSLLGSAGLQAQKSGIKWGELGRSKYNKEVFLGYDDKRNMIFASWHIFSRYQVKTTFHEVALEVYSTKQELVASVPVVLDFPELSSEKFSSSFGEKVFIELDSQIVLIGQAQYKRNLILYHCKVDINKREVSSPVVFFKSELQSGFDIWSDLMISSSKNSFAFAAKNKSLKGDDFKFFVFDRKFDVVNQLSLFVPRELTDSEDEAYALSDDGAVYLSVHKTENFKKNNPLKRGEKSVLFYIKNGEKIKQNSFEQDEGLLIDVRLWSGDGGNVFLTGYHERLDETGLNEIVFMLMKDGVILLQQRNTVKDSRENVVCPVYSSKGNCQELKERNTDFPTRLPVKFFRKLSNKKYLLIAEESITYGRHDPKGAVYFAGDLYFFFVDDSLKVNQKFTICRNITSNNYLGVSAKLNFQVVTDGLNGGVLFESFFYGKDAKKSEYKANSKHTELVKWENMIPVKRKELESLKDRDRRPIYWSDLSTIVPLKSFFCFGHQGFGPLMKKNLGKVSY